MKSRSRGIWCFNDRIALKFDRHLGSTAVEVLVKFQNIGKSLNSNLSRYFETLRDLAVRRLTAWWIKAQKCIQMNLFVFIRQYVSKWHFFPAFPNIKLLLVYCNYILQTWESELLQYSKRHADNTMTHLDGALSVINNKKYTNSNAQAQHSTPQHNRPPASTAHNTQHRTKPTPNTNFNRESTALTTHQARSPILEHICLHWNDSIAKTDYSSQYTFVARNYHA